MILHNTGSNLKQNKVMHLKQTLVFKGLVIKHQLCFSLKKIDLPPVFMGKNNKNLLMKKVEKKIKRNPEYLQNQ